MQDVAVFGLSSGGESETDLEIFNSAFQVTFPIMAGTSSTYNTYRQPGATSPYPLDYIIDQAGRIAYFKTEYDPEAMVAVIDKLLASPAAAGDPPRQPKMRVSAHPNPFNPRTEIQFTLAAGGKTTIDLHDARGRLVRHLVAGRTYEAGPNRTFWDGTDDSGRSLPTGLYLVRVRSGGQSTTGKLTLVR